MSWVLVNQETSGVTSSIEISASNATSNTILVTRSNPTSGTLQSWNLEYKVSSASSWESYATGLSAQTQTVADLNSSTSYNFRGNANVIMVVETPYAQANATTISATSSTTLVVQKNSLIAAYLGNGMLSPVGTVPLNGAIPPEGRTLGARIQRMGAVTSAAKLYGVRFLLGNLRNNPISGAKMICGWSAFGGAGPVATIGSSPLSGYVQVTIDGNPLLPIPAAPISGFASKWTDVIRFPGGVTLRQGSNQYREFDWRFYTPQMTAETDYAETWSAWGSAGYERISSQEGALVGYNNLRVTDGAPKPYLAYSNGDIVTNPTASGTWYSSPIADGSGNFGPPGPEASKILAAVWYTEEVPL